ncbi:MAG: DUF47 family protein [Candidatus Melainabacteria bacterium]|jgi:predicted phosphate transport protein (TIGR00153 family)|nr:DUF47 family protein [Candidatus Melainabacteria bacterium]MBX9672335.1 DUF47 family protein [Candidatus Obscuribacterales bacterium]
MRYLRDLSRFFAPKTDFYALLIAQAHITVKGMEALEIWLGEGAGERCQAVRDLEHRGDEQKSDLQMRLVESFITPFDREDIYDLSVRLDEVLNSAKNVAREVEALNFCPRDEVLSEMAMTLVEGARCLYNAVSRLKNDLVEASLQADLARKSETRFEKVYRRGMRELFESNDTKTILRTVEVYRALDDAARRIDMVAEKLHHIIVKLT